jgi:hypothetical protein
MQVNDFGTLFLSLKFWVFFRSELGSKGLGFFFFFFVIYGFFFFLFLFFVGGSLMLFSYCLGLLRLG